MIVTVVDERCGWPLPGVRVVATAPHHADVAQTTGSDGVATFALPDGDWRFTASLRGVPPVEARISLRGGSTERVALPLRMTGDGFVISPHGPCGVSSRA